MQQHHQSANSHKVGAVGETNEEYGGNVMNHLFLEILEHTKTTQYEDDIQHNHDFSRSTVCLWSCSSFQLWAQQIYVMPGVICWCV